MSQPPEPKAPKELKEILDPEDRLDDEDIDDETGLEDPEYYLAPKWLQATLDVMEEEKKPKPD